MAKKKAADKGLSQYAEDFGFQLAFLKSDPELYGLFKKAVKGTWTSGKFQTEIQKTKWYRTHTENYRQNLAQSKLDPATYKAKMASTVADIAAKANALGATFNAKQLNNLAEHYLNMGWSDSQLNNVMSKYITFSNAHGAAQTNIQQMQQVAYQNGLRYSGDSLRNWAQAIANGTYTFDDFAKRAREHAKTLAPGFADQLNAGVNLSDIASPYMQTMAQMLEINPADVDLFDPTIRKALAVKGADGKLTSMAMPDFEQTLRNDHRYLKTDQARDSFMSAAHGVLATFGLAN